MITTHIYKNQLIPLLSFLMLLASCKECPTEPENTIPLTISAPYIEASTVWLRISADDSTTDKSFSIVRDSVKIYEGSFLDKDTMIVDKTVNPNAVYSYFLQYSNEESEPITVTTMDLSRSDFKWKVYYFGERNNILKSVSIGKWFCIWNIRN